jgi:hypothetical protein
VPLTLSSGALIDCSVCIVTVDDPPASPEFDTARNSYVAVVLPLTVISASSVYAA